MSRLVYAAGLAIILVAPRAFSQAIPNPPRPPEITAAGRGEVAVTPDRAAILVSVESRAASAATAAADNATKMAAVFKALRAAGLAQADITTSGYSVGQDPRSMRMAMPTGMPPGVSVPVEFLARNTVRAIVRRIDDTGKVIDAALAAGATSIASVQFSSANTDEARRNALATAVAQAQRDAETLARAAGGSLGRLLSMSSSGSPIQYGGDASFSYAIEAGAGAAYPTMINPRDMSVFVSVFGRWEFVPGPSR